MYHVLHILIWVMAAVNSGAEGWRSSTGAGGVPIRWRVITSFLTYSGVGPTQPDMNTTLAVLQAAKQGDVWVGVPLFCSWFDSYAFNPSISTRVRILVHGTYMYIVRAAA